MKRLFCFSIVLVLVCVSLSSCAAPGLDKDSITYKRLQAAIKGPTATPGPTQDPTEANIQAFAEAINKAKPVADYQEYARYPMKHKGERIQFNGMVIGRIGQLYNTYLMAMDGDESKPIVVYCDIESLIIGDSVQVRAVFMGEKIIESDNGSYLFYPNCATYEIEFLN